MFSREVLAIDAAAEARRIEEWIVEMMRPEAIAKAGVFDPTGVERLWKKCLAMREEQQFSQADNMAVVGILSTQLLHHQFVAQAPSAAPPAEIRTIVDAVTAGADLHRPEL